jgi:adenosylhomocysteinase
MAKTTAAYKVKNIKLAEEGRKKIEWAESRMPVLMALREKYSKTKPLKGFRIAGCLHVTKETAVLVETLVAAGANVSWSGCNPLSTNDEVAAALAANGVSIYAWHGMSVKEFYWAIERTLDFKPNLTLDDGADLIFTIHNKFQKLIPNIIGGTEETTTGVHRLRAMADAGRAEVPGHRRQRRRDQVGFRQRVRHGPEHARRRVARDEHVCLQARTSSSPASATAARVWPERAKGLGANTIITEIKPTAALKATLEGHQVMTMDQAAKVGDRVHHRHRRARMSSARSTSRR